ncbi:hypothetical protein EBZ38_05140 [bacterium]|nr:hypothetical protein [bacterium]
MKFRHTKNIVITKGEYKGYHAFIVHGEGKHNEVNLPRLFVKLDANGVGIYVYRDHVFYKDILLKNKCYLQLERVIGSNVYVGKTLNDKVSQVIKVNASEVQSVHFHTQIVDQVIPEQEQIYLDTPLENVDPEQTRVDLENMQLEEETEQEHVTKDQEPSVCYSDIIRCYTAFQLSPMERKIRSEIKKILGETYASIVDPVSITDEIQMFLGKYKLEQINIDAKYITCCVVYNHIVNYRYLVMSFPDYVNRLAESKRSEFGKYFNTRQLGVLLDTIFLDAGVADIDDEKLNDLLSKNDNLAVLQYILDVVYKLLFNGQAKRATIDWGSYIPLKRKDPFRGFRTGKRSTLDLQNELRYANLELLKENISQSYKNKLIKARLVVIEKLFYMEKENIELRYALKIRSLGTSLAKVIFETGVHTAEIVLREQPNNAYTDDIFTLLDQMKSDLNSIYEFLLNGTMQPQDTSNARFTSLTKKLSEYNKAAACKKVSLSQRRNFLTNRANVIKEIAKLTKSDCSWCNWYIRSELALSMDKLRIDS